MQGGPARVLAIDAGGTMTDAFLVDGEGRFVVGKAQTTPHDESVGLMDSARDALSQWRSTPERAFPGIASAVFSGTAMLNRLLERKGLAVGCLVSGGLEDYLRFERGVQTWLGMSYADRLHTITHHHNEPLVPLERMAGVRGRIDVFGREAIGLYEDDARAAAAKLLDAGSEAIVISFLNSFRNDAHERRTAQIVEEVKRERGIGDELPVFLSSELYPLRGDFPRLNSTLIEAYAAEPSRRTLKRIERATHEAGARFSLRVMAAHGGTISTDAGQLARTLVSGPIGGVVGACHLARELGIQRSVCSDIGGTSFDLALVVDGDFAIRQTPDIGRFLLNLPMVEIESVGAGTGSFVRIDPTSNRPEIGPQSAGAGIGVSWPEGGVDTVTITDLDLVLGRLNPDNFLGGQVGLDVERARHEVGRQLAAPLGLSVEAAAGGVVQLFEESLRFAALSRVLGKGFGPVDFSLFCYGGGGPLHVAGYTRGVDYADVLVPAWAAGFSAFGCACADFSYRYDLTLDGSIGADGERWTEVAEQLGAAWTRLRRRVDEEFARAGVARDRVGRRWLVRMQYAGQLNDIEVEAHDPDEPIGVLIERFEEAYGRRYARGARSPELGYTITSAIVIGTAPIEKPRLPVEPLVSGSAEPHAQRPVWWAEAERFVDTGIYDQNRVRAGQLVRGPAIVEAASTTMALPPGRSARLDEHRIFHLAGVGA